MAVTLESVSDREVVDAILILHEDDIIRIGRYSGRVFVQYDPTAGLDYFYGNAFRCTARPKARRRMQTLETGDRHGVFISHIADEKPIALRIQRLINDSIKPALPVFVSSDYQSIESGEEWYRAILAGLRRSSIVIALLSNESVDRRWINFEAGFGLGQESKVIPVAWRGMTKGDIGLPLGQLQSRDLIDPKDVKALIDSVAAACHAKVADLTAEEFCSDIVALHVQTPSAGLEAIPFLRDNALHLAIRNSGNRPLDMIDAELQLPNELQGNAWIQEFSPVRELSIHQENGTSWRGHRLTTIPSTRPHLGVEPLRPVLVRDAGEILLQGLTLPLPSRIPDDHWNLPIRFRVSSRQQTVGPVTIPLAELPKR